MKKVKIKRTTDGKVVEVAENVAASMIARGKAEPTKEKPTPEPEPANDK